MAQRFLRMLPRLVAVTILVNLALLMGCGGSAGVDNGRIVGKVFSNLRDRSAQRLPEPGVSVVAQREGGTPQLIRTTVTGQDGTYQFPDLPTGAYVVGFAKEGFITIDTSAGATTSRTALGSQVRVFIDSGRTSVAPDVTMRAQTPSGDVTIIVTVKDRLTDKPITDAVVTVGAVSQTKNVNGVYTLSVPVPRTTEAAFTSETVVQVSVSGRAEGFKNFDAISVRVFPGETTKFNMIMAPFDINDANAATIEGTYRYGKFQTLLGNTQGIKLHVRNVPDGNLSPVNGRLDPANGTWTISGLPPSTSTITRQVDIVFEHPDLITKVLSSQVVPRSGSKTIVDVVTLEPILVNVIGQVRIVSPAGTAPTVPVSNDSTSFVIIPELGLRRPITGGSFIIDGVPVRQVGTDIAYKITASGEQETTGQLFTNTLNDVRPLSTRLTGEIDNFDVGLIQLTGGGGQ